MIKQSGHMTVVCSCFWATDTTVHQKLQKASFRISTERTLLMAENTHMIRSAIKLSLIKTVSYNTQSRSNPVVLVSGYPRG